MKPRLASAVLLATFLAAGTAEASDKPARRLALVVGSNASDGSRPELRYAVSDARAVAQVLAQLGGVAAEDQVLLETPDRRTLVDGFARLGSKIDAARGASSRVEVLVYYSGHSDEGGLILGRERFSYAEARQAIHALRAQVRIAIFDSCASGALVRPKGGVRVPPFLIDGSTAVRGHAYLTATTAEEAAQESDRIKASYFTYALLSGLRGAADSSRDGKVTLSEAYQFAFDETLARTESSRAGPQHPTYDIELVGSGDLVMTDLRGTSASILLAEELDGRVYLRGPAGHLVAELRKVKGAPIELGLEPGRYDVTLDQAGSLFKVEIALAEGSRALLSKNRMAPIAGEVVATRGPERPPEAVNQAPPPTVAVDFALLWPISSNGADRANARNHVSIPLLLSVAGALDGVAVGTGVSWVRGRARGLQAVLGGNIAWDLLGVQTALGFNTTAGTARGAQLAGGFNWAHRDASAVQAAWGFNVGAGPVRGAQLSTGFNFAMEATGLQLSTGANIAAGRMLGLQAGFANVAGAATGIQLSSGANLAGLPIRRATDEDGDGFLLQLAAGANYAHRSATAQVALLNIALDSAKVQAGLVNFAARRSDLQVGLVKLSETPREMLGLINLSKNGYLTPAVWASDLGANVGIKSGGRTLYTVLAVGWLPGAKKERRFTQNLGLGVHLSGGRLFVDVDVLGGLFLYNIDNIEPAIMASLRAQVGWQVARHLAVVAGPTFNAAIAPAGNELDLSSAPEWVEKSAGGLTTVRMYPGFVAGLQF